MDSHDKILKIFKSRSDLLEIKEEQEIWREINFRSLLNGTDYKITWYCNISYLSDREGLTIPFDQLSITGTWPNQYKNNLQLYYKGNVCCILPLEEYP